MVSNSSGYISLLSKGMRMEQGGSNNVAYQQRMETFATGPAENIGAVPTLEPATCDAVMRYLLELACQAQNTGNIQLGRAALLGLPRAWLLAQIERHAEPLLHLQDEWEYRRLGELYAQLDNALLGRLAARGLSSPDSNIRQSAHEFEEWLGRSPQRGGIDTLGF
jgi:hypothetical protein